jgi:hypothetical protein
LAPARAAAVRRRCRHTRSAAGPSFDLAAD